MHRALIDNWNSVVGHEDTVYHLGDFGFKGSTGRVKGIMSALNGTKILIRGNHDKSPETMLSVGFAAVFEQAVVRIFDTQYLLQHYKMRPEDKLVELLKAVNCDGTIHGHVHNNEGDNIFDGFSANVSVEVINYTPIELEALHKAFTKHRIENGLFIQ